MPTPDHGEFQLRMSLNDDLKIIRSSTEMAKKNPSKPGHYWQRMVAKGTVEGETVEIVKQYHIDLHAGVVEITETLQGEETARRTMSLDDLG
jgi:hypothetical protein